MLKRFERVPRAGVLFNNEPLAAGFLRHGDYPPEIQNAASDFPEPRIAIRILHDVLEVTRVDASFPHRVGLRASCHGQRGLRLASGTERVLEPFDKVRTLLASVDGIDLVPLDRPDACCGFGGTFAVDEPAVSVAMGRERLDDHVRAGADVITGTDVSCLLHLEGLALRANDDVRFAHVAQILNGGPW